MGMYFSEYKFEMVFGHSPQSKTWTPLCNGKQVKGLDRYICSCRVDDALVLQVVKPWCVRGYYRRHTLANYKRKHNRPSK